MNTIRYYSRGYKTFVACVKANGAKVMVGAKETKEIINAHLFIKNPRDRIVTDQVRGLNFAFAIAEWVSTMTGENRIEFFTKFIRSYSRFSSDGKTLDGCYGARLIKHQQIHGVIDELLRDINSRRAVMAIYEGNDLHGGGGKNTPCTLNLQFFVRHSELNMIVTMRSNDVWLGLPYDAFNFTMIQEFIANQIGVPLGVYHHNAGSLHIYEENYDIVGKLGKSRWPHQMPPMPSEFDFTELELLHQCGYEAENLDFFGPFKKLETQYARDLALTMRSYVLIKSAPTEARLAAAEIRDITFRHMARMPIMKAGLVIKMEKLKVIPPHCTSK